MSDLGMLIAPDPGKLLPPFLLRTPLLVETERVRIALPVLAEFRNLTLAVMGLVIALLSVDYARGNNSHQILPGPLFSILAVTVFGLWRYLFPPSPTVTSLSRELMRAAAAAIAALLGLLIAFDLTLAIVLPSMIFEERISPLKGAPRFIAKSVSNAFLFIRGNSRWQFSRIWQVLSIGTATCSVTATVGLICWLLSALACRAWPNVSMQHGFSYVMPPLLLLLEAYRESAELRAAFKVPVHLHGTVSPLLLDEDTTAGTECVVAHISDVHLTRQQSLLERQNWLGQPSRASVDTDAVLQTLLSAHADDLRSVDLVLLTGDITDKGAYWEWLSVWEHLLLPSPSIVDKLVLVPGNHDVNVTIGFGWGYREDKWLSIRKARMIRFLSAVWHYQRTPTFVFDEARGILQPFRDFLEHFGPEFNDYIEELYEPAKEYTASFSLKEACEWRDKQNRQANVGTIAWDGAFPLIIILEHRKLAVIVLDSNRRSKAIGANAFGEVSHTQLRRIPRVCEELEDYDIVVAMHHHLVLPDEQSGYNVGLKVRSMAISNAGDVINAFPRERLVTVFHGHHHVWATGAFRNFRTIGIPSASLGDASQSVQDDDEHPGAGFLTAVLARMPARQLGIKSLAWNMVSSAGGRYRYPLVSPRSG